LFISIKYYDLKLLTVIIILIIIFITFRFVDGILLVVTKYYLSQQSQHQHILMIWKNVENIVG
jgi:hypothetical protein